MPLNERWLPLGLLWMRGIFGLGLIWHGAVKVIGGRMPAFTQTVAQMNFPAPAVFAWAATGIQLAGGVLIVLGLKTRPAAALVFVVMSAAVFIRHGMDPWTAKELALAYWTAAGTLTLTGPGRLSLDNML